MPVPHATAAPERRLTLAWRPGSYDCTDHPTLALPYFNIVLRKSGSPARR